MLSQDFEAVEEDQLDRASLAQPATTLQLLPHVVHPLPAPCTEQSQTPCPTGTTGSPRLCLSSIKLTPLAFPWLLLKGSSTVWGRDEPDCTPGSRPPPAALRHGPYISPTSIFPGAAHGAAASASPKSPEARWASQGSAPQLTGGARRVHPWQSITVDHGCSPDISQAMSWEVQAVPLRFSCCQLRKYQGHPDRDVYPSDNLHFTPSTQNPGPAQALCIC